MTSLQVGWGDLLLGYSPQCHRSVACLSAFNVERSLVRVINVDVIDWEFSFVCFSGKFFCSVADTIESPWAWPCWFKGNGPRSVPHLAVCRLLGSMFIQSSPFRHFFHKWTCYFLRLIGQPMTHRESSLTQEDNKSIYRMPKPKDRKYVLFLLNLQGCLSQIFCSNYLIVQLGTMVGFLNPFYFNP